MTDTPKDLTAPEQVEALIERLRIAYGGQLSRDAAATLRALAAERDAALGLQQTDHEQFRCAECDCENGGAECTWIASGQSGAP